MSILIKGMEMPKDCIDCVMECNNICSYMGARVESADRHPSCPLIEVKPHGRLIDADALYKVILEDDEWVSSNIGDDEKTLRTGYQCAYGRSRRMIRHAPTIIESEGEE